MNYVFADSAANVEFGDVTFLTPNEYSVTVTVTDEEPEERICTRYDLEGNEIGVDVDEETGDEDTGDEVADETTDDTTPVAAA